MSANRLYKILALVWLMSITVTSPAFGQQLKQEDACLLYCNTWNFLKYTHPQMAAGCVNADSLFLADMPKVLEIANRQGLNTLLLQLLERFPVPAEQAAESTDAGDLLTSNFNLDWFLHNRLLSPANRLKLQALWRHRYTGKASYYLPALSYDAEIPHEPAYPFAKAESIPPLYRLLALAKLQGAADYLFPHKYLMPRNFNEALKEAFPVMLSANSREQYERTLLKLTALFRDTHSFGFYKQLEFKKSIFKNACYPPFTYHVFDDGVLVTGLILEQSCISAELQKGDYITAINGQPVKQKIEDLSALLSASNHQALVHRLSDYVPNLLWGSDSATFHLSVRRGWQKFLCHLDFPGNGQPKDLASISRHLSAAATKKSVSDQLTLLDDSIVYFRTNDTYRLIANSADEQIDQHMDSLLATAGKMKGIIFDMRGYPDWGGFVYTYIFRKFGSVPHFYARYYELNKQKLGTYILRQDTATYYAPGLPVHNAPYQGNVVIIVNSETLSQSEWNTMNLQAVFPNAITIGEQTAGADGDIKKLNLPGGYVFEFTGNAIFYNNGREAQQNGVRINRLLPRTRESLLSGNDNQLEAAISLG
ncbi:S41 family peptidase [Pseudoflavitalea rhizosphaerae]|uniref:S41 family peptidase n=1 Tax=Pseudoflavitalea rhizosphaerae TaxID=1884793 RepID=UPI000F8E2ED4|nr:S41 family peptidase [Pseudoflavitalea rhizosphaerae]